MKFELRRIKPNSNGYHMVEAPEEYPGYKNYGKYAPEHRVIFWLHYGYLPPKGWHIHHKNGDHTDNRVKNLEAISVYEHARHRHHGGKKPAKHILLTCHNCQSKFTQVGHSVKYRKSLKQRNFYCSKSCNISATNRMRKGIKLNYPKNRKSSKRPCTTQLVT